MTKLLFSLLLAGFAAAQTDLGTVRNASLPLRAVGFGDSGYEGSGSGQDEVARSIQQAHRASPFHLGLTLGDNFYPRGVRSVDDEHWKWGWRDQYDALGIRFYASLGNHDYMGSEQAQIAYSSYPGNKSWQMPAHYYTYAAGPVRFFALDTDEGTTGGLNRLFGKPWSDTQAQWLDGQLTRFAAARWKVVYGHHPIYSDGHHGDTSRLVAKLLPILKKHKVDVYLAGHDHDMQRFESDGMQFLVVGGGGKDTRRIKRKRAVFAEGMHGFLELEADNSKMTLRLTGTNGKQNTVSLTK